MDKNSPLHLRKRRMRIKRGIQWLIALPVTYYFIFKEVEVFENSDALHLLISVGWLLFCCLLAIVLHQRIGDLWDYLDGSDQWGNHPDQMNPPKRDAL